jgi:hypothetical protein
LVAALREIPDEMVELIAGGSFLERFEKQGRFALEGLLEQQALADAASAMRYGYPGGVARG